MCLDETHNTVRVGKQLSDMFPIKNGLNQGDVVGRVSERVAWHYASYRTRSAKQHARKPCLPHQQDIIPYVVKTSQSCAPEDGQKLARNMLS
jgi:hypothetical protein